jgi:hypothetical protein
MRGCAWKNPLPWCPVPAAANLGRAFKTARIVDIVHAACLALRDVLICNGGPPNVRAFVGDSSKSSSKLCQIARYGSLSLDRRQTYPLLYPLFEGLSLTSVPYFEY